MAIPPGAVPRAHAGFLSRLTFWWMTPTIMRGRRIALQEADLPYVAAGFVGDATSRAPAFLATYAEERQKLAAAAAAKETASSGTISRGIRASLAKSRIRLIPQWSITLRVLARLFGWRYLRAALPLVIWLISAIGQAFCVRGMVLLLSGMNPGRARWRYLPYCLGLFCGAEGMSLSQHSTFFHSTVSGVEAKAAIIGALYARTMRLDQLDAANVGTLVSVDAQRILEASYYVHFVWFGFIQVVVVSAFLVWQLGPSALFGVLLMLLTVPFQLLASSAISRSRAKVVSASDARVWKVHELLKSIRAVKLLCLESQWSAVIRHLRDVEVRAMLEATFYKGFSAAVFFTLPVFVILVSFSAYVFIFKKKLNPAVTFGAVALFNVLGRVFIMMPYGLIAISESLSAFARLDEFFNKYAISEGSTCRLTMEDNSMAAAAQDAYIRIIVRNADFGWHKEGTPENRLLTGISLQIRAAELVACIGPVGSGKSSLLLALLNELDRYKGTCATYGRIAYCGQDPWILNADLKRNITLFGRDPHIVDEQRYRATLHACCLSPDVARMPAGDDTEIGEKGVTLSGGQKSRVALARAIYSDADIYLLDDPLSSVDATVAKQLKQRLFGLGGMLRDKAVIIVTHQLHMLPVADRVLVLSKGIVLHDGSFQSLLADGVDFGRLIEGPIRSDETADDEHDRKTTEDMADEERVGPKEKGGTTTVAEDRRIGKVPLSVYMGYIRAGGGAFAVLAIFATFALSQGARSGSEVWLRFWSAHQIRGRGDSFYALIFLMFSTLAIMFAGLRAYLYADRSTMASRRCHDNMFDRVLRATPLFFERNPSGRILNRFSSDMDNIDVMLPVYAQDFLQIIFYSVGSLIIITSVLPWFLIALIGVIIAFVLLQQLYLLSSRELKRLDSISKSPVYSQFVETVAGSVTIRAACADKEFAAELERRNDRSMVAFLSFMCAGRWLGVRLDFLASIIVLATSLLTATLAASISSAAGGLALTSSLTLTDVLQWATRQAAECENIFTSVERIIGMSRDTPVEAEYSIPDSVPDGWPRVGVVEFDNVCLRYRPDLPFSLQGLSFKTEAGEKIGICGRTGAGKSSLVAALLRMVEVHSGAIRIDDVDVSKIGLRDLRSKVSVVSQDPVVFAGTVRANLDPTGAHEDAALGDVLRRVRLIEEGSRITLDTVVSSGGGNLSSGERQLLTLARAIVIGARVVVLDEATSYVDGATDEKIQAAIKRELADCTLLTIAHRLDTIIGSDKIMVMDKGRCVEWGSPAALIGDTGSYFSRLIDETGPQGAILRHRIVNNADCMMK